MTLDPNNDIYQGDLATLNTNKRAWETAEKGSAIYRTLSWVIVAVGFVCIVYVALKVRGGTTTASQLPLHASIWITAILAMLVSRQGKRRSQQPFASFHMAHFEVDDDTVYYQYQKGMTLQTYYIKDKDIKKIYRDDIRTRSGESDVEVSEFYALLPFDKFDLDDLLAPYKKKVVNADGKLREKYTEDHLQ